jgi:hypothetical protein
MKDSTTAGWENQYSAITAGGVDSSVNYAISWIATTVEMSFNSPAELNGFYVTNATYAYLSMKNGDTFSKKFGGVDGTDPDYFKLIIYGKDGDGNLLDSTEFFLADFRFEDSGEDYFVNDWQWVDLTSLGTVSGLEFKLESTDVGDFGMNTPAYFCLDNFTGSLNVSARINDAIAVNIYPNPAKSNFVIESKNIIHEVILADISGKIILQQKMTGEYKITISDLERFPKGVYFLRLQTGKENLCRKILIN